MQPPIQATRRPARGRQAGPARRMLALAVVLLALVASVAGNVVQAAWHGAYAADAEQAMRQLRDRVRLAEQERDEAQSRLADVQADYMRRMPQD